MLIGKTINRVEVGGKQSLRGSTSPQNSRLKKYGTGPGQVAQLVGASSQYAEVAGSIPSQGIYRKQPMNCINKWNNESIFLFLPLPLSFSL